MMDIYASDEEKGEQIKQWWRDNGATVLIACLIGLAAVFGVRYWQNYQQNMSESASLLYQSVITNMSQDNIAEADSATKKLMTEYSATPYATFSALEMAEKYSESDIAVTSSYYQWVISNAELEGHAEIARLRLARIMASDKKYDDALAIIEKSNSPAFVSLFSELKGDIHASLNQKEQAHQAYQQALSAIEQDDPRKQLVKLKSDDTALNDEG